MVVVAELLPEDKCAVTRGKSAAGGIAKVGDVAGLVRLSRQTTAAIRHNVAVALGLKAVFLVTMIVGVAAAAYNPVSTGLLSAALTANGPHVSNRRRRAATLQQRRHPSHQTVGYVKN